MGQQLVHSCWPLFEEGALSVVLDAHRFSLHDAADAHRLMESGGHIGKIALQVKSTSRVVYDSTCE